MRIIQVINALIYGDAVSNDITYKSRLLNRMGFKTAIYSKWADEKSSEVSDDIKNMVAAPGDIVMHHYTGFSHISDEIIKSPCTKVLVYHNITPPEFFSPTDIEYEECRKGLIQVKEIAEEYDFITCDSAFNKASLNQLGIHTDMDILPILLDFESIEEYCKNKRSDDKTQVNFLFVGRVAPNKKLEDVIEVFNHYYQKINSNSKLTLVGNYHDKSPYYQSLYNKSKRLACRNNIYFTGLLDNDALYSNYADADIFLCMSEHEGFCVPLVESMYFRIPVIAYDSCAVADTMGGAGVLLRDKNPEMTAKLCHTILTRDEVRESIVGKQRSQAESFSEQKIKELLDILITKWIRK
jgi:glycosyltransferase involved in cell wall biosynthesis